VTTYPWPSREEWAAKAEYSVRTFCTPLERLEEALPGANWSTLGMDVEMEELGTMAVKSARPLLTAEIKRLQALLPDRPPKSRARVQWFCGLEGQQYEDACNLGALEELRRLVARAVRDEHWHTVAWELGRVVDHCPAVALPAEVTAAVLRMRAIGEEITARRAREANRLVDEAVAAEVARRESDEGWAKELERRARIERPLVTVHPIGAAS
jgi:hypothetical protein